MAKIIVTERAAKKFKEFAQNQGHPEAAMRLALQGGGCSGFSYLPSIEPEPSKETDFVFNFDQFNLKVYVDRASMLYLDGTEIDYIETLTESGFQFRNPNVKRTCGCGSSFSVD